MTGMGSNSSSVPTSAPAGWGSKSEIRKEESAGAEEMWVESKQHRSNTAEMEKVSAQVNSWSHLGRR